MDNAGADAQEVVDEDEEDGEQNGEVESVKSDNQS
jgi:hypothetical protein